MKTRFLLAITAAAFTAASAFAGDKACCATATTASNKHDCEATFANLDLNAEQKAKMQKLAEECTKGGCNKDTMAKMEESAKSILSKEQLAAWKAACGGKATEKA